ncbi:hypothetical protein HanXRQr2_Chr12g0524541 [Helianthus annuus]|uniref:Serine-rich protein-related protein n=1 Tax=Helianthus annuus TaxID=4232 RepID=A0A251SZF6_HELAN|nr:uncharacterized protein LOC110893911 [Helianthus annuus]KAF5776462.1 hypothetical protein HanXRQr2_Chr12g0524541 [Helianthus annuus]KAJ0491562.1 hypothetical protein HanIR_Chr12g0565171 [Helianthus annuus]KAJ0673680.1 hypothetical protein HanLR1_Chr12g0431761 [Helianthus annuus]
MAVSTVSTRRTSGPVIRSHSPSRTTSSFASTSSAFSTGSTSFFRNRSESHTHTPANLYRTTSSSSSVRFSLDNRPISPSRSISSPVRNHNQAVKKTCMCSPTTHPGSFRCSLHKNSNNNNGNGNGNSTVTYPSNRLNARRSAMTNSLVRIGTVEGGDLVKRALAALIRPSSHQQRRRTAFQARPSRLSVMSKAEDV